MKHLENAGNEKENLWYFCDQETSAVNILGSNLLECGVITNKRGERAPPHTHPCLWWPFVYEEEYCEPLRPVIVHPAVSLHPVCLAKVHLGFPLLSHWQSHYEKLCSGCWWERIKLARVPVHTLRRGERKQTKQENKQAKTRCDIAVTKSRQRVWWVREGESLHCGGMGNGCQGWCWAET